MHYEHQKQDTSEDDPLRKRIDLSQKVEPIGIIRGVTARERKRATVVALQREAKAIRRAGARIERLSDYRNVPTIDRMSAILREIGGPCRRYCQCGKCDRKSKEPPHADLPSCCARLRSSSASCSASFSNMRARSSRIVASAISVSASSLSLTARTACASFSYWKAGADPTLPTGAAGCAGYLAKR